MRRLLICATIEELPNDVGQPVAWTEPVVFDIVSRAPGTFSQRLSGEKCLWSFLRKPARTRAKLNVSSGACMVVESIIRDLPSHDCNWFCARWSITVHLPPSGEATPCVGSWRRLRACRIHHQCQIFFLKLQEFWVVTNRGILEAF